MQMALRRPISQVVKQLEAKVNLAGLGDTITPQAQLGLTGEQSLAKAGSEPPARHQWNQWKGSCSAWVSGPCLTAQPDIAVLFKN